MCPHANPLLQLDRTPRPKSRRLCLPFRTLLCNLLATETKSESTFLAPSENSCNLSSNKGILRAWPSSCEIYLPFRGTGEDMQWKLLATPCTSQPNHVSATNICCTGSAEPDREIDRKVGQKADFCMSLEMSCIEQCCAMFIVDSGMSDTTYCGGGSLKNRE